MKKILIIILAGVLLHPLPTKAQFGQDAVILVDVFLYRGLVFFRCRIKGKFFLGKLHDIFCGMSALPDTYRVVGFLHRQDDLQIPGGE